MTIEDQHSTDEQRGADSQQRQGSVILHRVIPITAIVFVVALAGLLAYTVLFPGDATGNPSGIAINEQGALVNVEPRPADDFTLPLFDGGSVRLSELRGQVVVMNFWASWCPPCREEARDLEGAWQELQDENVVFLGINVWDDRDDALAFVDEFGVSYPNGPDESGQVPVDYGVRGIPETFIIDADGRIAAKFVGPVQAPQLIQTVRLVSR